MSKKNIFSERNTFVQKPNRNTFDLSFQNNLTMEFGKLYPVFCKEVIPGDSFRIKPTFALRTLPMHFPVQTRMQVNLHFFYVRNRNLWKNWPNFIGNLPTPDANGIDQLDVPPFLSKPTFDSRSLGDYLGIPTTLYGGIGSNLLSAQTFSTFKNGDKEVPILRIADGFCTAYCGYGPPLDNFLAGTPYPFEQQLRTPYSMIPIPLCKSCHLDISKLISNSPTKPNKCEGYLCLDSGKLIKIDDTSSVMSADVPTSGIFDLTLDSRAVSFVKNNPGSYALLLRFWSSKGEDVGSVRLAYHGYDYLSLNIGNYIPFTSSDLSNGPIEYSQLSKRPFDQSIHINALPFRAYESIYNAFYRNQLNDPLLNGAGCPVYNEYLLNTQGGDDQFNYKLHYRNWELDFLTSAVQSPQQGIAPLVGVSMNGTFTFANKHEDGSVDYFSAHANIEDNGKITGFQLSDKQSVSPNSTLDNVPDSVKQGTIYNLNQLALAGISINDFRNVNSLQRWLETNIRRGYRYRDQLMSHFGVEAKYEELDMPEFLGGMSEPIYINSISETSQADGGTLGDYAGQGSVMASSEHSIEHYCDEHGFIMGILSISPVPNYSQLLPKMFIKSNYLDYFFPEFGHIGLQPIDYREVCPLQAAQEDVDLTKVFGYQRPWYDYIASVDEVHGEFRTDLRNFLCNRQFSTIPRLNHDFLKVDPAQLNDIFSVTDTTDKVLGQIYFDVSAKRPIPRMGIPRLE